MILKHKKFTPKKYLHTFCCYLIPVFPSIFGCFILIYLLKRKTVYISKEFKKYIAAGYWILS